MGLVICEGYGLTETSPVIAVNHPGHIKVGTVGTILPDVEVKLDDAGSKNDSEGREILVRGPNVTSGYYRLERKNQEAFADGWFRTGDLGKIDAEGYLSITGRKKNLFKTSGGKYVAPEKLENLFQGHLYISQIMIIGDRRKFVSALIVPNFPGPGGVGAVTGAQVFFPQGFGLAPRSRLLYRRADRRDHTDARSL